MSTTMFLLVSTRFHCFPKLSIELRLMIWTFSLPGPRYVEIKWIGREELLGIMAAIHSDKDGELHTYVVRSRHRMPVSLHVNQEHVS